MKKVAKNATAAATPNANNMSVYTRTGDKGTTSLFGGKRVSKSNLQVEAYGSVDELTSYIGLISSKLKVKSEKLFLLQIQKDLYKIIAHLSNAKVDLGFLNSRVKTFEKKIDASEKKLPKLTRFILPGGSEISAWYHILRVVCRRSERSVVRFFSSNETMKQFSNEAILKYLNRLSDLFFTLARWYGRQKEILL